MTSSHTYTEKHWEPVHPWTRSAQHQSCQDLVISIPLSTIYKTHKYYNNFLLTTNSHVLTVKQTWKCPGFMWSAISNVVSLSLRILTDCHCKSLNILFLAFYTLHLTRKGSSRISSVCRSDCYPLWVYFISVRSTFTVHRNSRMCRYFPFLWGLHYPFLGNNMLKYLQWQSMGILWINHFYYKR